MTHTKAFIRNKRCRLRLKANTILTVFKLEHVSVSWLSCWNAKDCILVCSQWTSFCLSWSRPITSSQVQHQLMTYIRLFSSYKLLLGFTRERTRTTAKRYCVSVEWSYVIKASFLFFMLQRTVFSTSEKVWSVRNLVFIFLICCNSRQ